MNGSRARTRHVKHFSSRLGISPVQTVVDLGSGTGSFARAVAAHGATVVAVDPSEAMLDYCAARSAHLGGKLRTQRAGFLTFDLPPQSVDLVVSRFALHHLPDFWKQVALCRIADVLRPGGTLYLVDVVFSFHHSDYADRAQGWIDSTASTSGWSEKDLAMHIREEYSTYSWILEGMLARAGFKVSVEHPTTEYAEYVCQMGRA